MARRAAAALMPLMMFASPGISQAADYRVDYAWEVNGVLIETGQKDCLRADSCKLRYGITASAAEPYNVRFWLDDLLFSDATRDAIVPIDGRKHILNVYDGRARRGNEVVLNTEVGKLTVVITGSRSPGPR